MKIEELVKQFIKDIQNQPLEEWNQIFHNGEQRFYNTPKPVFFIEFSEAGRNGLIKIIYDPERL